ncbi:MAG: DUF1343 domain-containing protein [Winogradskyella sp.]|uniref:exo-beta-N-acetylmuramidase NamZ family protein n=1 Tax=Winogradskyella sp. TaxID=1883156 RepID=UPI0017A9FD52|nr:DUF1343 domain-containing protein [Winogradskyella sp.]
MRFKVFKNTVLLVLFILISCGNKVKQDASNSEHNNHTSNLLTNRLQDDKSIVVGANRTAAYLPLLKDKKVALVANQTSVIFKKNFNSNNPNKHYTHLVDSLLALNIDIKKVFSPEHGFRGTADAGESVNDGKDSKTGLPILSLHGTHKKPTPKQLEDIDILIFDIQDVGVRFYTYISTLHYVMEACAELSIPLLILDRPNPNGSYIDGPVLEKEYSSFLGMHPVPLVHGMTIGEYAKMINGESWLPNNLKCDLTIVKMENYNHNSSYSLPIRPSPNLPNDQSILLYPSLGLFEGTNINAGRGTEFQFQRYGAPFLNKTHYNFSYTPVANFGAKYPKHQNTICYGVNLADLKMERKFTLKFVIDAYNNAEDKSKVFNTSNFTKHAGTEELQEQIVAGLSENDIKETWSNDLVNYRNMRDQYVIYD